MCLLCCLASKCRNKEEVLGGDLQLSRSLETSTHHHHLPWQDMKILHPDKIDIIIIMKIKELEEQRVPTRFPS